MPLFTPELKHHILQQHRSDPREFSFAELARRYAVKGGREVVREWWQRWNGSPASLMVKQRSGRPRLLSRAQINRHIRAPILAANRAHRAIHYTELLSAVRRKTRTGVSLRSLQRYGKDELGARDKHSKKRTADESECSSTRVGENALVIMEQWTDFRPQCLVACVSRSLPCDANCSKFLLLASSFSMRLLSVSAKLRITHLCFQVSKHSSRRRTLLPTLRATT